MILSFYRWLFFTTAHSCKAHLHNKFAQIIELNNKTPVGLMRHNKSNRNNGITSYVLLDNVPAMETLSTIMIVSALIPIANDNNV
jgi:hypothetical protein